MAAGSVHDRITFATAGIYGVGLIGLTGDLGLSAWNAIACLVGGCLLSPDLDIRSLPFQRWGPLRVIWIPYQKLIRHRSPWSHAPVIGTTMRVVYLAAVLTIGWFLLLGCTAIGFAMLGSSDQYQQFEATTIAQTRSMGQNLWAKQGLFLITGFGSLEVGALSHIVTDHFDSWRKRQLRKQQPKRRSKGSPRTQSTQIKPSNSEPKGRSKSEPKSGSKPRSRTQNSASKTSPKPPAKPRKRSPRSR